MRYPDWLTVRLDRVRPAIAASATGSAATGRWVLRQGMMRRVDSVSEGIYNGSADSCVLYPR